jgi:hypothetical protein
LRGDIGVFVAVSIVVGYCEDIIGEGIVGTIGKGLNVKRSGGKGV